MPVPWVKPPFFPRPMTLMEYPGKEGKLYSQWALLRPTHTLFLGSASTEGNSASILATPHRPSQEADKKPSPQGQGHWAEKAAVKDLQPSPKRRQNVRACTPLLAGVIPSKQQGILSAGDRGEV